MLQGVEGWPMHRGVLQRIKAHGNNLDFSVTVSFFHFPTRSFFGSTWQSGAGAAQKEGGGDERFRAYGVTLNEVVNWYTYIDDPRTCVLAELVATESNPELSIAVDSFACGWTVLQPSPFGRRGIPSVDSKEEGESADQLLARGAYLTAPIFKGTPRSLLASDSRASLEEVLASLEEEALTTSSSSSAVLRYQLVTHHALLKARSLFAENELVGSNDIVPGLQLRRSPGEKHKRIAAFGLSTVNATGGTVSTSRKKLRRRKPRHNRDDDDDDDDDSVEDDDEGEEGELSSAVAVARGVHLQPTLELEVSKPLVRVQDCAEMEVAMRRSFDWSLDRDESPLEALKRLYPKRSMATASERDAALALVRLSEPQTIRFQVLERRLRFVVHNSRQVVDSAVVRLGERDRTTSENEGNQAPATELFAVKGKNPAKAQEDRHASISLKGFCRHKQMAVVAFLEYVVRPEQNGLRVPLPTSSSDDLTATFPDPTDRDEYLTTQAARATIVVGAAHFLPFDGKLLRLRGTCDGRALNAPCDEKTGRFTLALQVDEATRVLASQLPEKPLAWPLPGSDDLFDGQRFEDPDKPLRLVKFKCEAREHKPSSRRGDDGEKNSSQALVADETPSDPANESDGDDDEGSGGEEKEDDDGSSSASEKSHSDVDSDSSRGPSSKKKKSSSRRTSNRRRSRSPSEKTPRRSTTRSEEKEEPASSPSSLDTAPSPLPSPRPRYHRTQPAVSFDATRGRDDDLADALMMHPTRGTASTSVDPSSSSLFAHTLAAPVLAETSASARNPTFVSPPGTASTFGAALLTNGRAAGGSGGHRALPDDRPPMSTLPFGGGGRGGAIPFGDSQADNHYHASSGQRLSRASRARLGASTQWGGPPPQAGDSHGTAAAAVADTLSADVSVEMSDPRCRSVLTLRFAAYRAPDRGSALPAAISISYRFFDRPPVRSGRMTLKLDVAQARGAVSNATPRLLVVEGGGGAAGSAHMYSRDEVGLPPDEKIVFDASTVTGGEAREVFEYLSHRPMYLDVWDADSLLLLGTMALPLHHLLRQGRAVVQRAFEYDVVAPSGTDEANATVELHSGMPPVGTTVGLLQVATCCYGEQGEGDQPGAASHVPAPKLVPQGALVNWRLATSANAAATTAADGLPLHEDGAKKRPSVRKRARPLTERGSEVTDALRAVTSNRSSHSATTRGDRFHPAIATSDDPSAVTYADLLTLSKRFRDETRKGRVMYAGKLLQLLDVPTVAKAEAALVKDLTALEDRGRSLEDLARLLDRHGDGRVRGVDLHEGLQSLCPRTFGRLKLRDAKLLVARIVGDSGVVNLPSLVAWVRQRQSTSGIETQLKELMASAKSKLGLAETAAVFMGHVSSEEGHVISGAHFVSAVRKLQSKLRSAQGEASPPQDKDLTDVHLSRFLAPWLDAHKRLQLGPLLDLLGLEGANQGLEAQGKARKVEGVATPDGTEATAGGTVEGAAAAPTTTAEDAMATPEESQKDKPEGAAEVAAAAADEPRANKENNASNDAASAKASQDDNEEAGESKVDASSDFLDVSQDPTTTGGGASEYVFSADPSTAALERKLRRVAQSFQARVERSGVGADVEALFSQYDPENTGSILRSELVNVLMQLGLALIDAPPTTGSSRYGDGAGGGDGAEGERRRRLAQMAKLKGGVDQRTVRLRTRQPSLLQGGDSEGGGFGEGNEELALLKWYREGSKKNMVKAMVEAGVKTELHICPRFATTTFFEQPVANPFSGEERLTVNIDKPHLLRIVTDRDEWQHLRQRVPPPPGFPPLGPGVEEDMVDSASRQLWVAPHETVHVPLACLLLSPHSDAVPDEGERVVVTFTSVAHGAVVALLHLVLHPRPPVVHRTLRIHAPEGHIVKRTFRVPTPTGRHRQPAPLFITTVEGKGQRAALVEAQEDHEGALVVALKYSKLGSFPASGDLFLALYSDKWRTSLRELWHVVVSSRLKKDVHASLGTATQAELVVRGDPHHQAPRRVQAYASNQLEVAFSPAGPFHLAPAALTRVALRWTPLGHPGLRTSSIHLVDVETKQLVAAWQLCAVAAAPTVTKEFEVSVTVGEPGHKKVSYENPWPRAQTYRLRSSDPTRMRPKVERVLVEARGRTYVRLYFAPQERAGTSEVFLLVNDEADQNDECFRIIINAEH